MTRGNTILPHDYILFRWYLAVAPANMSPIRALFDDDARNTSVLEVSFQLWMQPLRKLQVPRSVLNFLKTLWLRPHIQVQYTQINSKWHRLTIIIYSNLGSNSWKQAAQDFEQLRMKYIKMKMDDIQEARIYRERVLKIKEEEVKLKREESKLRNLEMETRMKYYKIKIEKLENS